MMQNRIFLGHNPRGFHRVAYTVWGDGNRCPSGVLPVICAHGLTRNGRDFDRLAAHLEAQGRTVYCPDVAGRGRSDWLPDPSFYGYPQYLADMTALIARAGAEQVDWVGTSMGGIIGMLMAALPGSPIRRLVVNDVGPFIPLEALQRIASYVGMVMPFSDDATLERHLRKIYAPFGALTDEDWRHLVAHGARLLPDGRKTLAHDPGIAQNFTLLKENVDFWPAWDAIRCPTLLLRGEMSDLLTAEVAAEMTRRGPRARLVTIPETGHAPALMAPDQIAAVSAFLEGT